VEPQARVRMLGEKGLHFLAVLGRSNQVHRQVV
jgi:hypothetical protein